MQDFTAGGIHALPRRSSRLLGDAEMDERIRCMTKDWGVDDSTRSMVEGIIITALKLGRDRVTEADMKLMNRALRELRHAIRVFSDFRHVRKVSVFGSARTSYEHPEAIAAEDFSRRMALAGYMIITGGGDGIMGAAQRGAGREKSFGLNIRLPFEQRANATIEGDAKLVNFNYFFTRKLNFVKESHAVVLFPGGFGTMDEAFEVLTLMQTGKARIVPVVMVDVEGGRYWEVWSSFLREQLLDKGLISSEDFSLFRVTRDLGEAIAEIDGFYRNYWSYRWVGGQLVFRLRRSLTGASLDRLRVEFSDLAGDGRIEASAALPEEANEPEIAQLPRLVLTNPKINFGRIRQMIDRMNVLECESTTGGTVGLHEGRVASESSKRTGHVG
jgi:uncharacterized protein (TIGR00730 family)